MEKTIFQKGIFEFVEEEKDYKINNSKKHMKRTYVRRPPGVRAIIINEKNEILLSKEYRYELEKYDYRLPGGKVFDKLEDYKESMKNNTLDKDIIKAVYKEVLEEVGIKIKNPKLYHTSHAGSSITWDLYYFVITDYEEGEFGSHLEEDEIVDGYTFKSKDEIIKMCLENEIHEERSVGVLLSYILKDTQVYKVK